jgi:ABC-type multidrug transport system ATPase subunit
MTQPADAPRTPAPRRRSRDMAGRRARLAQDKGTRPSRTRVPPLPPLTGVLVARRASKSYSDLVALAPLDLAVAPGERVALVGHNGSGKSTFLRLAAGLLELTAGEIEVAGHPVGAPEARAALSFVPDNPVLYDDLSVREHLAYIASLHGVDASEAQLDELIAAIGLAERADDLPARFSRGLRQKAALAVGLVRPFQVLLVDEPFVGLDVPGRQALLSLLDEAHAAGAAIVVATHEPSYVERVDRCLALRDGRLIHDGPSTPDEVVRLVGDQAYASEP